MAEPLAPSPGTGAGGAEEVALARMPELLARVDRPAREAPGLPSCAYGSDAFFRLEQRRLFSRNWFAVGFVDDVPEPGDVHPVASAAGQGLVMVRGQDGRVRVFHNYCRHRGMRLVAEPKSGLRHIVCPYHAWCYDLDGALVRRPHYQGFGTHEHRPKDAPRLEAVRSTIWNRVVFVNPDARAPDFEQIIGPLQRRWAHYEFGRLVRGASLSFDVSANWKLAVENFIDIYHLPSVHPGLNRYCAMQDHYFVREGDHVVGQGTGAYAPEDDAAGKLPAFPHLDAVQNTTTEALSVFPNLLVTVFNDNLRMILVEPTGPATCRERVEVFFAGEAALRPGLRDARERVVGRFPAFNHEDLALVAGLQESLMSTAFEHAHFSAFFDEHVLHFQRMVAHACAA